MTEQVVLLMQRDKVPWIEQWADYAKLETAESMWYGGYAAKCGDDGRLRTSYKQKGTRSTRLSVGRVNLQAIPQDYRLTAFEILAGLPTPRHLIAAGTPAGWAISELDLQQAELRVAAMRAKCAPMLEAFAEGRDLHSETTLQLFTKVDQEHSEWAKYRQIGKRGNFSLCFRAGPATFAQMVAKESGIYLPEREAKRIVGTWNELYPEFRRINQRYEERVQSRQRRHGYGWIKLANDEMRWYHPREHPSSAFNQWVQGSLAQFELDWMMEIEDYLSDPAHPLYQTLLDGAGGLILVIHDSQVLLLPDTEEGDLAAKHCAQLAIDAWPKWFEVGGGVDVKKWEVAA